MINANDICAALFLKTRTDDESAGTRIGLLLDARERPGQAVPVAAACVRVRAVSVCWRSRRRGQSGARGRANSFSAKWYRRAAPRELSPWQARRRPLASPVAGL